jgi:hypothetical protein
MASEMPGRVQSVGGMGDVGDGVVGGGVGDVDDGVVGDGVVGVGDGVLEMELVVAMSVAV